MVRTLQRAIKSHRYFLGFYAKAGYQCRPGVPPCCPGLQCVALRDGTVLLTGGDDGTVSLATAELFDPAIMSFTPTESMHTQRDFHTATLRNDGTVLVAGGASFTSVGGGSSRTGMLSEATPAAELFDPTSGKFTLLGDMANARAKHTATLLPGGEVLVTGGIASHNSSSGASVAPAELFQ